jgi:hypothetical protein
LFTIFLVTAAVAADHGSTKPVESLGNRQDRVPCPRIGQLSGHFPRLLGAVEPLQGFV